MANNTLLASDSFVSGSLAAGWAAVNGETMGQVVAGSPNTVQPTATSTYCEQIWTGLSWPKDQISEVTLNAFTAESNTQFSLLTRFDTATVSGYVAHIGAGATSSIAVYKYVSGTPTQLGSTVTPVTVAAGDVWAFTAGGAGVMVYQNGIRRFYYPDVTYTTGYPGFGSYSSVNITHIKISSWRGYSCVQRDGVWTKQGVVIPPIAGDYTVGPPPGAGTFIPTQILHEGGAQILSGTVYKMWFGAGFGTGSAGIYYAESTDGIAWTRYGSKVIADYLGPAIIKVGATYYLYAQSGAVTGFGLANYFVFTSADGITWSAGHDTGIGLGTTGAWDDIQTFTMAPVTIIAGTWYGLYSATHLQTGPTGDIGKTGLVTSADGLDWTKYGGNPVLDGWITQATVKVGSLWYTWIQRNQLGQLNAVAGGLDPTECVRCSSPDLITWTTSAHSIHHSQPYEGYNTNTGQSFINALIDVGGQTYAYLNSDSNDASAPHIYQISLATAPTNIANLVTQPEDAAVQIASDSFVRANGALGANWTTPTGLTALQIASNKVEPSAANAACAGVYTGASFNAEQYSEITFATLGGSIGQNYVQVAVRMSTTEDTSYSVYLTVNSGSEIFVVIQKRLVGVGSSLSDSNFKIATPTVGDVFRLQVITGSDGFPTLLFYQNNFLILQGQDTTTTPITSGNPGVLIYTVSTITQGQISAWAGGNANVLPSWPTGGGVGRSVVAMRQRRRG